MKTYTGMRAYYRRRVASNAGVGGIRELALRDSVRVFLRDDARRMRLVLVLDADKAKLFERGESYTIEED